MTYLSCKFVSSCITNLLISKYHLVNDVFSYVVLTQPQFKAFCAFAFCASLRDIHWETLTSESAGLIWVDCCQHSGFCGGRSCSLVRQEVGDGILALIVWADIISPGSRVRIPRLHRDVEVSS